MKYRELVVEVNKEELDKVVETLATADITSLVIDDPDDAEDIKAHPEAYKYDYLSEEIEEDRREKAKLSVYFDCDEEGLEKLQETEDCLRKLQESMPEGSLSYHDQYTGDDSEWLYKWQEHFKPTRVGDRIVVKPSWEDYEPEEKDIVIEMDPGMAFGSGLHETTTLCIKALEMAARERGSLEGLKILDVGTGTGILAIAAKKLGAGDCLGVDIDEDAIKIARENVERNGLSGSIELRTGDLMEGIDFEADIIVANLMADLVIKLAPAAAAHLKNGGIFISSGILDIKCDKVADEVQGAGFEIKEIIADGEWRVIVAFLAVNK